MSRSVSILSQYLIQSPVYLVWIAGIVLAIARWRRHPTVSLLTLASLVLFSARSLIGTFLNVWLPITLHEQGIGAERIGVFLAARGVISALVAALAWGLLIAAVFGWRREASSE